VASVTAHGADTVAVFAALHILHVDVTVVALEGSVTRRVTVLAARRSEDTIDLQKRLTRGRGVGPGSLGRGIEARDETHGQKRNAERDERCDYGTGWFVCPVARHDFTPLVAANSLARMGRRRTRLPVAAKIAFVRAGATGGTLGSPTPVGLSSLGMM